MADLEQTIEQQAGEPQSASAYGNPFGFTGQRYGASAGLYRFLYRTYSPGAGRSL